MDILFVLRSCCRCYECLLVEFIDKESRDLFKIQSQHLHAMCDEAQKVLRFRYLIALLKLESSGFRTQICSYLFF